MKKSILLSALVAAGLAMAPLAPAAYADDMKKDTMSKDEMKKDDGMKKDTMSKDSMKKDDDGTPCPRTRWTTRPGSRPGSYIRGSGRAVYSFTQRLVAITRQARDDR